MTDYKQTVANYKSTYQKRMLAFLKKHEDAGVDERDFINEELNIWREVKMELLSFNVNSPYTRNVYLGLAIESLGSDGDKILKYRSRAIIDFLNEKFTGLYSEETEGGGNQPS